MAKLLHYTNKWTQGEYIVITEFEEEGWDRPGYTLESTTDIGEVPVTLPTERELVPD